LGDDRWAVSKKGKKQNPLNDVCSYCDQLKECPWWAKWGTKEYAICSDCTMQARLDHFDVRLRQIGGS